MSKVTASSATISRPGARFATRRSLHHGNPQAMRRHNERVGAVIHAYNSAHSYTYIAWLHLAVKDNHQATRDIWFSFGSDKAQRDFVINYVRNHKRVKPLIRNRLIWALTALNQLATFRNDIAHADMVWSYTKLEAGFLSKDSTRKRLDDRPFDEHWRHLKGDFSALSNYIMDLAWDILAENARPSAKKPRLKLAQVNDAESRRRAKEAKERLRETQRKKPKGLIRKLLSNTSML